MYAAEFWRYSISCRDVYHLWNMIGLNGILACDAQSTINNYILSTSRVMLEVPC